MDEEDGKKESPSQFILSEFLMNIIFEISMELSTFSLFPEESFLFFFFLFFFRMIDSWHSEVNMDLRADLVSSPVLVDDETVH